MTWRERLTVALRGTRFTTADLATDEAGLVRVAQRWPDPRELVNELHVRAAKTRHLPGFENQ